MTPLFYYVQMSYDLGRGRLRTLSILRELLTVTGNGRMVPEVCAVASVYFYVLDGSLS
jgi:hypothetical protein